MTKVRTVCTCKGRSPGDPGARLRAVSEPEGTGSQPLRSSIVSPIGEARTPVCSAMAPLRFIKIAPTVSVEISWMAKENVSDAEIFSRISPSSDLNPSPEERRVERGGFIGELAASPVDNGDSPREIDGLRACLPAIPVVGESESTEVRRLTTAGSMGAKATRKTSVS